MGTPYQPDFSNCILLMEDGVFEKITGVIFGTFANCIAKYSPERDGTIDDVINEWSQRLQVPCIKDFPYGHIPRRCVLPIGKKITLDGNNVSIGI